MVYEFGARLLQLRKEKNLTQQVLVDRAKALDPDLRLSDSVLGKYESDHAVPRLTEAAALAEVLGVSLDFLTSGETSRTLPLKDLNETQIQLLLDLTQSFRHKNEHSECKIIATGVGAYGGFSVKNSALPCAKALH